VPSPVGHALGGLIVGLALVRHSAPAPSARAAHKTCEAASPPRGDRRRWALLREPLVLGSIAAACLPDLDFLWGRHNLETHSVGFALLVGAAALAWTRSPRWGAALAVAVGTHVLFDWLGSDTTPPLGVLALWPFSSEFYFADAFLFEAISRRYWLPNFLEHNLRAVALEIVMLGPPTAVVWWWRTSRARPK
jgi:inner membrane protein